MIKRTGYLVAAAEAGHKIAGPAKKERQFSANVPIRNP